MKTKCSIVCGAVIILLMTTSSSCKKEKGGGTPNPPNPPNPPVDTTTVNPQVDPPLASTIGFFMDDWEPKNFTILHLLRRLPFQRQGIRLQLTEAMSLQRFPVLLR